ncbi:trehalose operon repressor [Aquibacillus sp. 3ASR75-11]|uniref:Trehalose operon repressor n=1 Tax=Terrihalobacillus insolitus TaxID=2950438 RepID=A0A9X3WVP6_9BACI|nr:trehalose operon repressor [Terrihalobacillus insolitus]MDC3413263.1 trehalose operon repressor [Terrihalobacillus insolitus]MDC3425683.1 trehalose operon repressor [Terrihalobacillus insolitus]
MKNKYDLIYQELVEKIQSGILSNGDKLPSENELAEEYETSRETIRKALHLLSQNGFIQKVRGKGSLVLDRNKFEFPVSGLVSFKELSSRLGQNVRTKVHELILFQPESSVKNMLHCSDETMIWKVTRTRKIDGENIILDKELIREDIIPGLTKSICEHSIYAYIEQELKKDISFAKKEIVVEKVSEEDREFLDLQGHEQVVVIRSFVYMSDATVFQYTESRHRPDKFRFVDFARRN